MPKSKKRKHADAPARLSGLRGLAQEAAQWPLYECLLTRTWRDTTDLAQAIVARRSPKNGAVVAGFFLIDLGCLGVKSAGLRRFPSAEAYRDVIEGTLATVELFEPAPLDLVAKVLREAAAYAKSLGFLPDPEYQDTLPLLHDAHPENAPDPIPLGVDGKPFYVSGPDDQPMKILRQLDKAVGRGNYDYTIVVPPGATPPPGVDPEHIEYLRSPEAELEDERLGWLPLEAIAAINDDPSPEHVREVLAPHWPTAVAREFIAGAPGLEEELADVPPEQLAERVRSLLPEEIRALFDGVVNARPSSLDEYLDVLDGINTAEEIAPPPELEALLQRDDPEASAAIDAFMIEQLIESLAEIVPRNRLEKIRGEPIEQAIPDLLAAMPDELRGMLEPQLNLVLARRAEGR